MKIIIGSASGEVHVLGASRYFLSFLLLFRMLRHQNRSSNQSLQRPEYFPQSPLNPGAQTGRLCPYSETADHL